MYIQRWDMHKWGMCMCVWFGEWVSIDCITRICVFGLRLVSAYMLYVMIVCVLGMQVIGRSECVCSHMLVVNTSYKCWCVLGLISVCEHTQTLGLRRGYLELSTSAVTDKVYSSRWHMTTAKEHVQHEWTMLIQAVAIEVATTKPDTCEAIVQVIYHGKSRQQLIP